MLGLLGAVLLAVCFSFFYTRRGLRFYILFELSLIPTLGMVVLFGYQPEKLGAGAYLILYTALRSLPLLFMLVHSTPYFAAWTPVGSAGAAAAVALTLAFLVKRPLYSLHLWLPKAHVESPVAGRIALAGVLLKLGSYGLYLVLPLLASPVVRLVLVVSVWGGVVCGVTCLRQWDLKSLVAYSSVVHMGVVGVGLALGSELGRHAALMMVVAHGVCSPALFSYAYYLYGDSHRRLLCRCRGGLGVPYMAGLFLLLVAVNMAVPPFINLWREVAIFVSALGVWSWA